MPLGLAQGETLVRDRTKDLASYDQYLRAKALVRARGLTRLTDAIAVLEPIVVRDPDFAAAWALLAQAYVWCRAAAPSRAPVLSKTRAGLCNPISTKRKGPRGKPFFWILGALSPIPRLLELKAIAASGGGRGPS